MAANRRCLDFKLKILPISQLRHSLRTSDMTTAILQYMTLTTFPKKGFLPSMGGPLHRAALHTLEILQENGFYLGTRRGNMLGTAFLPDKDVKYYLRICVEKQHVAGGSWNGLWIEALHKVRGRCKPSALSVVDTEFNAANDKNRKRASQLLHHLVLETRTDSEAIEPSIKRISKPSVSVGPFVEIVSSQLSAIAAAMLPRLYLRCFWLAPYFAFLWLLKYWPWGLVCGVNRSYHTARMMGTWPP
jgi:hypothetical protein